MSALADLAGGRARVSSERTFYVALARGHRWDGGEAPKPDPPHPFRCVCARPAPMSAQAQRGFTQDMLE
eukprot:11565510-Alexandrium_andersonii.AAC.1